MSENPRLLVVTPDRQNGIRLTLLLSHRFRVMVADQLETALAAAAQQCPDVILCEASVAMDPSALAARVNCAMEREIPMIILAPWSEGCENRARDIGAAAFLPKPFLASELRQVLDALELDACAA